MPELPDDTVRGGIFTRSQPRRTGAQRGREAVFDAMNAGPGSVGSGGVLVNGSVTARVHEGALTVTVAGPLDRTLANELLAAVGEHILAGIHRVEIDITGVTEFTPDGATVLARCRHLCTNVSDGLHFRTEGGAGQLAVLAAFERESE